MKEISMRGGIQVGEFCLQDCLLRAASSVPMGCVHNPAASKSLYRYEAENKLKLYEGWMWRYIGEILLNIDDNHMSEAEDWIKRAIEANGRNGMRLDLGWDYASYAELLKRKGDLSEVKENLTKAIEIYKECGADGWVERADGALAKI